MIKTLRMKHGNWCGPGWSNGRNQTSVRGYAPAVDEFDETCRQHDFVYADDGDLAAADFEFARMNLGTASIKRNLAGVAVGLQGLSRRAGIIMTGNSTSKKRLRTIEINVNGTVAKNQSSRLMLPPAPKRQRGSNSTAFQQMASMRTSAVRAAPAAYSNTVTGHRVTSNAGVTTVSGREFAAGSANFSSSNIQLVDVIAHHPAYYATSALGNLTRSFREYRWDWIRISYLGTSSTATAGWTQLVTNPDMQESGYNYASNTDLLQRSMSTQNAVLGNVWENLTHIVPTTSKWMLTQPFDGSEYRDHTAGETYVYQQAASSTVLGLVVIDYQVSFRDLYYTLHSSIPFTQYAPLTLADSVANPAASAIVTMTNSTISASPAGSIWRLILLADQSTAGTGATITTLWKIYTDGSNTSNVTTANGSTVYAIANANSVINLFPTFESAKISSTREFMAYRSNQTTASSLVFQAVRVSLGTTDLVAQT